MRALLLQFLKLGWQREKESNSWKATVANQRAELRRLFRQSPSIKNEVTDAIAESYGDALRQASIETDLPGETFPQRCPFTAEQILSDDFFPE